MNWPTWLKYKATSGASKSLEVCDSLGEKLAWWFGITQPKYLYEIEEYLRIQKEEQENNSDNEEIEIKTIKIEEKRNNDGQSNDADHQKSAFNSLNTKPYQL